jgi:hypothetical protein
VVAAAFGDVSVSGGSDGVDHCAADRGEVDGAVSGAGGGGVFGEGHVPDVVASILDRPVFADEAGEGFRAGIGAGQIGDGVDGLVADLEGRGVLAPAGDLDCLARVGEVQVINVDGFQRSGLIAAVAVIAPGRPGGDVLPRQGP